MSACNAGLHGVSHACCNRDGRLQLVRPEALQLATSGLSWHRRVRNERVSRKFVCFHRLIAAYYYPKEKWLRARSLQVNLSPAQCVSDRGTTWRRPVSVAKTSTISS